MKYTFALILLVFISCSKQDIYETSVHPEKVEARLHENAIIKGNSSNSGIAGYYQIQSGNKIVFEYQYTAEDNEMIADDEYSEFFVFQIDPSQTNIELKDDQVLALNPIYRYSCYCYQDGGLISIEGSLKIKKKTAGKYEVTADLLFNLKSDIVPEGENLQQDVKFSVVFKK